MRAVILYDGGSDEWSAQDVAAVMANVREVRTALRRAGHEPVSVPVHLGDFRWLTRARKADLVFNLCEGINGKARYEDFVVGALELTGVPFTGCRHWPIAVCHRKYVAKFDFPFTLLSDPDRVVAQAYGATKPDGKGVQRSVVLIARDGRVIFAERGAPGADQSLTAITPAS